MPSYGELCTRFYDLDKPRAPELALAWFSEQLRACAGRVLEPMCGSGRFLVPMVQAGLQVDGVDDSAPMLAACRARLGESEVRLWQQSLETMDLEGAKYAGAFIPAGSFCLMHEPEVAAKALARLREHLSPGGLLLIEFELPHDIPPGDVVRTINDGREQIRLVVHSEYDAASQLETMSCVYELKQSGKVVRTENETLYLRCYRPEQMTELLTAAGFCDVTAEHQDFGWIASARA